MEGHLSFICLISSDVQPRQKHKLSPLSLNIPAWHLLNSHILKRVILKDVISGPVVVILLGRELKKQL